MPNGFARINKVGPDLVFFNAIMGKAFKAFLRQTT